MTDTSSYGTAGPWDCTWEPPGLLSALLCYETRIIFSTDLNHTIQAFRVCDVNKMLYRHNRTNHSACVFKTSTPLYEICVEKDCHAGCCWLLKICNGSVEERCYRQSDERATGVATVNSLQEARKATGPLQRSSKSFSLLLTAYTAYYSIAPAQKKRRLRRSPAFKKTDLTDLQYRPSSSLRTSNRNLAPTRPIVCERGL